jgi:hypothetical protein
MFSNIVRPENIYHAIVSIIIKDFPCALSSARTFPK